MSHSSTIVIISIMSRGYSIYKLYNKARSKYSHHSSIILALTAERRRDNSLPCSLCNWYIWRSRLGFQVYFMLKWCFKYLAPWALLARRYAAWPQREPLLSILCSLCCGTNSGVHSSGTNNPHGKGMIGPVAVWKINTSSLSSFNEYCLLYFTDLILPRVN